MTYVLKSDIANRHYAELTETVSAYCDNYFTVSVAPYFGDGTCGYPLSEKHYKSRSSAMAAYRRIVKKYILN